MSRYRNQLEIVAEILNIVKEGARKTQIMYRGNLSHKVLKRYLELVVGSGLVIVGGNANVYRLTEKGLGFLKDFEDYSRSRREIEPYLRKIRNLRLRMGEMCALKRVPGRFGLRHESDFSTDDNR